MIDIDNVVLELEQEFSNLEKIAKVDPLTYNDEKLKGYKDAIHDLKVIIKDRRVREIENR